MRTILRKVWALFSKLTPNFGELNFSFRHQRLVNSYFILCSVFRFTTFRSIVDSNSDNKHEELRIFICLWLQPGIFDWIPLQKKSNTNNEMYQNMCIHYPKIKKFKATNLYNTIKDKQKSERKNITLARNLYLDMSALIAWL